MLSQAGLPKKGLGDPVCLRRKKPWREAYEVASPFPKWEGKWRSALSARISPTTVSRKYLALTELLTEAMTIKKGMGKETQLVSPFLLIFPSAWTWKCCFALGEGGRGRMRAPCVWGLQARGPKGEL